MLKAFLKRSTLTLTLLSACAPTLSHANRLDELDHDTQASIFRYLRAKDLCTLACTSKSLNGAVSNYETGLIQQLESAVSAAGKTMGNLILFQADCSRYYKGRKTAEPFSLFSSRYKNVRNFIGMQLGRLSPDLSNLFLELN